MALLALHSVGAADGAAIPLPVQKSHVAADYVLPSPRAKVAAKVGMVRQLKRHIVKVTGSAGKNANISQAARRLGASPSVIANFEELCLKSPAQNTGGRFEIAFERYFDGNGNHVRDGRVLYVQLDQGRAKSKFYLLKDAGGNYRYYDDRGRLANGFSFMPPLKGNFPITSKYGMRKHPISGKWRMHKGVDFGAPRGTKVYASADAIVEFVGYGRGYGNYIKLSHDGGRYHTLYAHLKSFAGIRMNQAISAGQHIGYVGSTGASTGNHLHYEVIERSSGSAMRHADPMLVASRTGGDVVFYHDMRSFRRSINALEVLIDEGVHAAELSLG